MGPNLRFLGSTKNFNKFTLEIGNELLIYKIAENN